MNFWFVSSSVMLLGSIRLMFGTSSSAERSAQRLVHRQVEARVGHRLDELLGSCRGMRAGMRMRCARSRRMVTAGSSAVSVSAARPREVERRPQRAVLADGVGAHARLHDACKVAECRP